MSKFKFRQITRVVAGVTLITAATTGCSDDAAINNSVITEVTAEQPKPGVGISGLVNDVLGHTSKPVFTIPNFVLFLNEYSNDLPTMLNVLQEFEEDFYTAAHKYFYLSNVLSERLYIMHNYGTFESYATEAKELIMQAMNNGAETVEIQPMPVFEDNGITSAWANFDWDNPPATPPNLGVSMTISQELTVKKIRIGVGFSLDCCYKAHLECYPSNNPNINN